MLKIVMLLLCLSAIAIADQYDTKYDDIDLDEILNSERLLNNYINCLLNMGPCTPDGQQLKDTLPDAIETDCSKCTEPQKAGANKVMRFIIDNRPDDWESMEKLYDPEGMYKQRYQESKMQGDDEENKDKN